VLRTTPLGEADLLVVLLAREAGKVRGVARSARRSRKRFGGALQPLSRVRATWTVKAGRDLHHLDEVDLLSSAVEAQSDLDAFYRLAHVTELAEAFSREDEGDERAFRLLRSVVEAVAEGTDPALVARYFEIWTLRLAGLLADPRICEACGASVAGRAVHLPPEGAGPRCPNCAGEGGAGWLRIPERQWAFLLRALRTPVRQLSPGRAGRTDGALQTFLHRALVGYTERPLRAHRALEVMERDRRGGGS
jgi:DNA repair protein RecO (recombination protein O)